MRFSDKAIDVPTQLHHRLCDDRTLFQIMYTQRPMPDQTNLTV